MSEQASGTSPSPAVAAALRSPLLPLLVTCALFMENLDATVLNTVTPAIAQDFRVSALQLKLALTGYLVSVAVFIPISGWVAERFGARRVFGWAISVFTLGSLACGLSQGLASLVVSRLVQGAGGALMVPIARLALMRAYPKEELVRVTNLVTTPSLIGPAVGPLLGGLLATYVHWRAVFLVNVPFGLLGLWVTQRALDDHVEDAERKFDHAGFVAFGLGLAGLSFGLECVGEPFLSGVNQLLLLLLSVALLLGYGLHARRATASFFDPSLFVLRTFRLGVAGSFLSRVGIGGVPFLLPLMYQLRFGMSAFASGVMVCPLAVAMILTRFAVRPLLRAFGFRRLLVANTLMLGAALAQFAAISPTTPDWARLAVAFVYGCFASVHFACMNVLAYVDVEPRRMTAASSIVSTVQVFAMSAGIGLGALLVHVFLAAAGPYGGAAYAFHRAFGVLGALTALSAVMFWRLDERDGRAASGHAAPRAH